MSFEDIRRERVKKLEVLRREGFDAYPAGTARTHSVREVLDGFTSLAGDKKPVVVAGRIMAKREHGGAAFFDLFDGTGKLQGHAKEDVLGEEYARFIEIVDIGDFIEAEGTLFETKRGEKTIEVSRWGMLVKSLHPLPEKWHGLQDVEERFRKRYLDILLNEAVRARFERRAEIVGMVRAFHEKNGFLEVETPMLHPISGGALARPFVTHYHALERDFYLRVAPELYLKRLLVAGFERVFEMGKSFRNEGIDVQHNPEFTMLESYAAYWDEERMMRFVEDLFVMLTEKLGENDAIEFQGKKIEFKKPFVRISFKDLLRRDAGVGDYCAGNIESLRARAKELGCAMEKSVSRWQIADEVYKKMCRPKILQPTFVTNHPVEISPLAKKADDSREVRRFQLIAGGLELTNAFSELNDPLDQRLRFEEQERGRAGGDEEAHRIDEDYIEALEYGMPPAAGLGIGIDRVAMLFTDTRNIREVVLFPTMRPK